MPPCSFFEFKPLLIPLSISPAACDSAFSLGFALCVCFTALLTDLHVYPNETLSVLNFISVELQ